MNEGYVSRAAIWAAFFWVKAVLLVGAVWALSVLDEPMRWIVPTAVTASLTIALAVVAQIRMSLLRLCRLVRTTAGLEAPAAPTGVRSLR